MYSEFTLRNIKEMCTNSRKRGQPPPPPILNAEKKNHIDDK